MEASISKTMTGALIVSIRHGRQTSAMMVGNVRELVEMSSALNECISEYMRGTGKT